MPRQQGSVEGEMRLGHIGQNEPKRSETGEGLLRVLRLHQSRNKIPSSKSGGQVVSSSSLAIIVPVVVAAVLLVAAVLYLVRKRRVAARQPHRASSMPMPAGEEVQAEA